jgi:hypothetical protein
VVDHTAFSSFSVSQGGMAARLSGQSERPGYSAGKEGQPASSWKLRNCTCRGGYGHLRSAFR